MNIIEVLESQEDFVAMNGASSEDINQAEKELGIIFSKDYRLYVSKFGAACVNGHEFTGVINSKRLNVVSTTLEVKSKLSIPMKDMYLLEDTGMDKILIWQNWKGELFKTVNGSAPTKIEKTFTEYAVE